MMTSDITREQLHELLRHAIGPEATVGLLEFMEASLATKADLTALENRLSARIELAEQRMLAAMDAAFATQTRTIIFTMLGSLVGLGALAFGLSRLA